MELNKREDIRNIAIIAHVDHGKTTLVDALLRQSNVFRTNEKVEERVMDSNDLEKERGITILSKNTAVMHEGVKINIVDTPGHADFGGEVERVLKMVDSVLLVVDSYEGPMPQTKFVLKKALELELKPIVVINKIDKPDARPEEVIDEVFDLFVELGANDEQLDFPIIYASARNGFARKMVDSVLLVVDSYEGPMPQTKFVLKKALELELKPIVVINKIDKPDARPEEVIDEVFDLFVELGANDEQLDFPIIYASARNGFARYNVEDTNEDMQPLFETIIKHVAPPEGYLDAPFQMLVTTLDSNVFVGKIALGKIHRGKVKKNQNVALVSNDGTTKNYKVTNLFVYNGLKREETDEAGFGDIVAISGVTDANIGETIADAENPEALPFVHIDEPTLSMNFMVNDSPFAGQEGEFVTSRHLRDRLMKELETNVSLRVREITPDCFEVSGRGELHLSILIETMRREGYEFQVSKANVIYKEENGKKLEPMEYLTIPLFETIIKHVAPPEGYLDAPFQMLVTTLDSNVFVGKIALGKIHRGKVKKNQNVALVSNDGTTKNYKVTNLFV